MRVLLGFDKFKGALSAAEACEAAAEAVRQIDPGAECDEAPIADGGEGTVEAIAGAKGGEWHVVGVEDPLGKVVEARYLALEVDGARTGVIEMSEASGLWRCPEGRRDPWRASTCGTGQLLRAAVEAGCGRVIVGLGGSATNDGGSGLGRALGFEFLDEDGHLIGSVPGDLDRLAKIRRPSGSAPRAEVVVASDVTNPLLGPKGAIAVYGEQKGVRADDAEKFESRLRHFADIVERDIAPALRDAPGAGAAGGLGFGLMAFCGAEIRPGFQLVAEMVDLQRRVAEADLVITGEGCLDAQTAHGKGPAGIAKMARAAGKPVVVFAGIVDRSQEADPPLDELFDHVTQVKPHEMSIDEAIENARQLVFDAVADCSDLRDRLTRL